MKLFRAQSTRRLMAALLVLVMGVIGPVQASVHAGGMAGHTAQIDTSGSGLNDSESVHAGHPHADGHTSLPAVSHPGADSPCVELCLLISLAPSVSTELSPPGAGTALSAHVGAPIAQGQPATPPPKHLF
ncbi:MAG: hypothetical protein LAT62_10210 [Natronospirillum sp.]|uniref:hypothetical protein n=1 Tax=Natronospirillum sp. TaxID=2812955 RepID=UPI0025D888BC|nr:hypothetical protein [Natronospirillum sp.]MCH8552300.1 hypothetical protein [Natronospirillum sp.]